MKIRRNGGDLSKKHIRNILGRHNGYICSAWDMLHHNKKQWWQKSDICSSCQQGKDDILHLFEDYSTIRILKKMMLGRERIGIKLLIINTKENNIEKNGAFIKRH